VRKDCSGKGRRVSEEEEDARTAIRAGEVNEGAH